MGRTQVLSTQPTPIFPSQLLFSRLLHQLPLHLCPVGAEGMSTPAAGCGSRPEHVLPASVPARVHVRERIPIPCLHYWEAAGGHALVIQDRVPLYRTAVGGPLGWESWRGRDLGS